MSAYLAPVPKFRAFDASGSPLVGGKLYSYAAGTSTPLATYPDSTAAAGTENTNPVILDANGEASVWLLSVSYKFILTDADDVVQYTVDNVPGWVSSVKTLNGIRMADQFAGGDAGAKDNAAAADAGANGIVLETSAAGSTISTDPAFATTQGLIRLNSSCPLGTIGNPPAYSHFRVDSTVGASDTNQWFGSLFQIHVGASTFATGAQQDYKVAFVGEAERGTTAAGGILAGNLLTQWTNTGAATGLEIDMNNKHADQQINDTVSYAGLIILNGSTYITDKGILIGAAPQAPAMSRGIVLTSLLDRGLQISGAASGVVSTADSGANTVITFVGGTNFSTVWRGQIWINGAKQTIVSVASTTSLTISGNLGTLTNVAYFYGYPDYAIYLDKEGTANTNGTNHFSSGKQRLVTSHWSGGAEVTHVFDMQSVPTSPTIYKLSFSADGNEKVYFTNSGDIVAAASVLAPQFQITAATGGATWVHGSVSEEVTLSIVGTTTDSVADLLPENSIIEAVVARVTTTITTATDWKLGDPTTAGRFTAAYATMTAGATRVGLVHADQTGAGGPIQSTAAKVRITTTGTPGAGKIRITVFYRTFTAPSS